MVEMAEYSKNILIRAAANGNLRVLKQSLRKGADVNIRDSNGKTPLVIAAEHGHIEAINVLIEAGARLNKRHSNGKTPLIMALKNGHDEAARLLVEAGADVNRCHLWETPLWYAVGSNHIECVSLLIEAGADVNLLNPLRVAAARGHVKCLMLLINGGADVNGIDDYSFQRTPLKCAVINNNIGCASILIKAGADVNHHNCFRRVLGYAHSVDIMRLLLRSGARINIDKYYSADKPAKELLVAAGHRHWSYLPKKADDLMGMCRNVIRKHLLKLDEHTHLFGRVTRLGLPAALVSYLVFDRSLDDDVDTIDKEEN